MPSSTTNSPDAAVRNTAASGRPAAGWATVPTSGVPTISTSNQTAPATAPAEREAATGQPPTPRRSTSLEDVDRPAAGHPAADRPAANHPESTRPESTRPQSNRPESNRPEPDQMPRAGRRAAPEPSPAGPPLRPGDINQIQIAFWDDEAVAHYRSAWHEVKGEFVDDPVTALTRAHDLLTEAVNELTEALLAERDELDPLRATANPDTESMRMAMRGYREFLDRILAL
ncbi:hypothetical protein LDL48_05595 [Wangella sp. NEAU-J3]|nr:hypothetical protein [Jidongwangia harbinensis]